MSRSQHAGLALMLLGCLALPAAAQERPRPERPDTTALPPRPPRDTTAADTVATPGDTLEVTGQDTVPDPPPRFSSLFGPHPAGVARTRFYWSRDDLRREGAITLNDLLEQIPGVVGIRAGLFQQPEAIAVLGQTEARVEVVIDGFVLDPLAAATFDLGTLELAHVEELLVERRLDVTRVHVSTLEPLDSVPYTRIEAATGEPDGNVLRAVFTAPFVIVGPLGLAIDRIDSSGRLGQEEADLLALWGKWGWFPAAGRGVQLEYRQNRVRRLETVPWAADLARRDLVLRARNRFSSAFAAELFVGHTSAEHTAVPASTTDTVRTLERTSWQAGARTSLRTGALWLDAELRVRDRDALALRQLDLAGGFDLGSALRFAGSFTSQGWSRGENASHYDLRAEFAPIRALGAFAEIAGGTRGTPVYSDSLGLNPLETHHVTERSGQRLGIFARLLGIDATAALVQLAADSARSFGLPFDMGHPATPVDDASGFEVFGRMGLWPAIGLGVTGSYQYWSEAPGWIYLPGRSWRLAAELHTLPLASRNLEIFGRLEHERRGGMLVPAPGFGTDEQVLDPLTALPARSLLNGYLQIRVIDVRAYIHGYDLLGDFREDLPGRPIRGPRIVYGVKWQLFN